jgi:septal ring factor EnvC (AmiA/AmiB activator)
MNIMNILSFFKINNIIIVILTILAVYQFYSGTKQYSMIQKLDSEIRELREEISLKEETNYSLAKVIEEQKTLISQKDFDLSNLQTTNNLLESKIVNLESGILALQNEIKRLNDDSAYWYKQAKNKDKVIKELSETNLENLQGKGVIDENSSNKVISGINDNIINNWIPTDNKLQIKSKE